MGGRIGTGAGTGVELNKKGEADGAAENIVWAGGAAEGKKIAGGAAAEQANCIWLISGETVVSEHMGWVRNVVLMSVYLGLGNPRGSEFRVGDQMGG